MKITATQTQVRQTPLKVRLVANQVKDLPLEQALRQLSVMQRRASLVLLKVIKQAIANAMNNHSLDFENLTIKSIQVTPGATYKRWRAVSRGRAHSIMKRTSHIKVELEVKENASITEKEEPKKVAAKTETKKTVKKSAPKKKIKKITKKAPVAKKKVATKTKKTK